MYSRKRCRRCSDIIIKNYWGEIMNLSELAGKEIVNLVNGERLGVIGECDIIVDEKTGKILTLSIPRERGFFSIRKDKGDLEIPWKNVKKIGNDMIIIEYDGVY